MKRPTIAIAAVFLVCTSAHAAPQFAVSGVTLTDLGTLGGAEGVALDLNDSGEIVGWSTTAQGYKHAFLWRGGIMEDIGTSLGATESVATGINNYTWISGTWTTAYPHAFPWEGLHGPDCQLEHASEAMAISDAGLIVGRISGVFDCLGPGPLTGHEAALWTDPYSPDLLDWNGAFDWPTSAHDVNSTGAIAGGSKYTDRMMRWNYNGWSVTGSFVPAPAGTFGDFYLNSGAKGINNAGAVVGQVWTILDRTGRAYFWDGYSGSSENLGLLPTGTNSYADDINEQRFIVGYGDVTVSKPPFVFFTRNQGFLYHADFGMYALPLLSGAGSNSSCEAYSLNERNPQSGVIQIVGYCTVGRGVRHAVRWDVSVVRTP